MTIVVGYDHSPDARAAVAWALDAGSPVTLLYAHEVPSWIPSNAGEVLPGGEWEQTVLTALDEVVADARRTHPHVPIEVRAVHSPPVQALLDASASASMIVFGSRGHSAVANLLGTVSTTVSAHACCPVVVVRGQATAGAPVVAGVDGSAAEEPVLRFAAEQAAARGAPLHVLTGPRSEVSPTFGGTVEPVTGHAADALTAASRRAQLVVVGCRGRGPFLGLLLGSVSQHLLRHSACTVAVVHSPVVD
ncbi:universal stress protein [Actinoplanes sp. NPDC048796]|uniref:universal stress protein n=1 Tax=Actinoplanes sp. NPDC048796 TaxID=3155640 RepID=UPI003407D454